MTDQLATHLTNTLSIDKTERETAIAALQHAARSPGYGIALLQVVSNAQLPVHTRQSAVITFKNYITKHWSAHEDDEPTANTVTITADDRTTIKSHIVALMLSIDQPQITIQISQALSIISQYDFPTHWPNLLPELLSKIQQTNLSSATDLQQLNSILQTMHSIFLRYRHEMASDRLWTEIKYVLENSQQLITKLFTDVIQQLPSATSDKQRLNALFVTLSHLTNIYLSLNSQDIPEYFEDHIQEWMLPFLELLKFKSDLLETVKTTGAGDDASNIQDVVQTTICEIATLYTAKYEEQFKSYVPQYVSTVWDLLTTLNDDLRYDLLVTAAIKFLTTVVRKEWYKDLFNNETALKILCEKVIVPQIKLRETDVDLFNEDAIEYVRRDIEGSDIDTRRRTTSDFVRGLCQHFEQQITNILMTYIQTLLHQYSSSPQQRYIEKDAAIYIVLAVTTKGKTVQRGVTQVNPHIDIQSFIQTQILPELQAAKINTLPIIKADAIRFVNEFRGIIQPTSSIASDILPLVIKFLKAEDYVVYTYAAATIERLLATRDANNAPITTKQQLQPHVEQLLISLFTLLDQDDSAENEYVMKCIMRICSVSQDSMLPYTSTILDRVTTKLQHVAKNPKSPNFNHYLFETIAALIQYICKAQPSAVQQFETSLFPHFGAMLSAEFATEFHSYTFQILAQLLELETSISPPFQSVFPALLSPALYENLGNIPALVRLLTAYLQKGSTTSPVKDKLDAILGIFQQLIAKKSTDLQGIQLLSAFFAYVPQATIQTFLPAILRLLFSKLQKQPGNHPFARSAIASISLYVTLHGFDPLKTAFDQVQQNVFVGFFKSIWLQNAPTIPVGEPIHRKYALAGFSVLLTQTPQMLQEPLVQTWPAALAGATKLASGTTAAVNGSAAVASDVDLVEQSEQTFTTAYAKLVFSNPTDPDYLPKVTDPAAEFTRAVSTVIRQHGAQLSPLLAQVPQEQQQSLQKLGAQYSVAIG